uniref:Uncharacterized protein n=1 Tax=Athene cunicularia TaxID=194338 RepID=A0A663MYN4_ATHCN
PCSAASCPGATRCWFALVLPVPKPIPPAAAWNWHPLLWSCLSSTPPSTLFCLKHFNVLGQQREAAHLEPSVWDYCTAQQQKCRP